MFPLLSPLWRKSLSSLQNWVSKVTAKPLHIREYSITLMNEETCAYESNILSCNDLKLTVKKRTSTDEVPYSILFVLTRPVSDVFTLWETNDEWSIINNQWKGSKCHITPQWSTTFLFPQEIQRFPSVLSKSCLLENYCYDRTCVLRGNLFSHTTAKAKPRS